MTLPGETVGLGAPHPGTPLQVCDSAAGYYIGYLDPDGTPYSRESVDYWASKHEAQKALDSQTWRPRDTGYAGPGLLTVVDVDWDSEPF